jgi:hypothetical protein
MASKRLLNCPCSIATYIKGFRVGRLNGSRSVDQGSIIVGRTTIDRHAQQEIEIVSSQQGNEILSIRKKRRWNETGNGVILQDLSQDVGQSREI